MQRFARFIASSAKTDRGLLALATIVTFLVLGSPAAHAASGPVLYVNGSTGTNSGPCRLATHPCMTIGWALSEAPSGSTIEVAPGTYHEQLDVTQNVTIKGAGATSTIIEPTTVSIAETDTDSDTPQAAIIYVAPGITANLKKLGVNGSQASGAFSSCTDDYLGIYYRDASGSIANVHVTDVQQPAADFGCQPGPDGGIYVATDSSMTQPTNGNGVPADWTPPPPNWPDSNVTISNVDIDQYDKNGITCDDVGTVCTITGSTVTGLGAIPSISNPAENNAQNGIQVWGANADITHSTVTGNDYTSPDYSPSSDNWTYYTAGGILVINAGTLTVSDNTIEYNNYNVYALWAPTYGLAPSSQGNWSITSNNVSYAVNNTGPTTGGGSSVVPFGDGFGDGIDLDGASSVAVSGNTADFDAEFGIALLDATTASITGNTVSQGDGDGIYVGDDPFVGSSCVGPGQSCSGLAANIGPSTDNQITNNTLRKNGVDGILADLTAQESSNVFSHNTSAKNIYYDIEDESVGSGTAGTANTWIGITCKPALDSNVIGLC